MTPDERQAIKVDVKGSHKDTEKGLQAREGLKNEIRAGVEKEFLKKEIFDELTPKESKRWKFLAHPALLLLIGFIFTTVLGTVFSSCWQNRQSSLEQDRLTRQAVIKQKYEIKDEVIKAVAETNTAAEDVLASYGWGPHDSRRRTDAPERLEKWQNASASWRTKSKILAENLSFRFNDPRILGILEQITTKRSDVGSRIQNLQRRLEESRGRVLIDKSFSYSLFGESDFNLSGLAGKLRSGHDAVSQYLRSRLSNEVRSNIDKNDNSELFSNVTRQLLTAELNRLVKGASLYEQRRFTGVKLCPETSLLLLKKKPPAQTLLRLNRLLLEDTYPDEITRSQNFEGEVSYTNCLLSEMTNLSKELMEAMRAEIRVDEGSLPIQTPARRPQAPCSQASRPPCQTR
jgi:hypothetical protein